MTFRGPVFGTFSVGDSRSKNGPKLLKIVSRMLGVVGRITFGPKILGWVALAGPKFFSHNSSKTGPRKVTLLRLRGGTKSDFPFVDS